MTNSTIMCAGKNFMGYHHQICHRICLFSKLFTYFSLLFCWFLSRPYPKKIGFASVHFILRLYICTGLFLSIDLEEIYYVCSRLYCFNDVCNQSIFVVDVLLATDHLFCVLLNRRRSFGCTQL